MLCLEKQSNIFLSFNIELGECKCTPSYWATRIIKNPVVSLRLQSISKQNRIPLAEPELFVNNERLVGDKLFWKITEPEIIVKCTSKSEGVMVLSIGKHFLRKPGKVVSMTLRGHQLHGETLECVSFSDKEMFIKQIKVQVNLTLTPPLRPPLVSGIQNSVAWDILNQHNFVFSSCTTDRGEVSSEYKITKITARLNSYTHNKDDITFKFSDTRTSCLVKGEVSYLGYHFEPSLGECSQKLFSKDHSISVYVKRNSVEFEEVIISSNYEDIILKKFLEVEKNQFQNIGVFKPSNPKTCHLMNIEPCNTAKIVNECVPYDVEKHTLTLNIELQGSVCKTAIKDKIKTELTVYNPPQISVEVNGYKYFKNDARMTLYEGSDMEIKCTAFDQYPENITISLDYKRVTHDKSFTIPAKDVAKAEGQTIICTFQHEAWTSQQVFGFFSRIQ